MVTLALDWPSNWGNDVRDQQIVPLLNQIGSAGFDIGLLAKDPASVFPGVDCFSKDCCECDSAGRVDGLVGDTHVFPSSGVNSD